MTMSRYDLSLAHRMAIGFGVLLAILIAMLAFVFERQSRSTNAQRTFVEEIAPRTELTRALQDEIFAMAIAVRSFLLSPDPAHFDRYSDARSRVRRAAQRLADAQATAETPAAGFAPLVDRYLDSAERVVASRTAGDLTTDDERRVAAAREAVVASLQQLVARERAETAEALAAITSARLNVRYALVTTSVMMVVCFVWLGTATTRSIAGPARELAGVAAALERGDWKPALALAPTTPGTPPAASSRDEMRILQRAFRAAAAALEGREQRLRADGAIAAATASTLDTALVADRVLQAVVAHAGAEIGVVYVAADDGMLEPLAHYAIDPATARARRGEGLPGQAVTDRRTLIVRDIPRDSPFQVRLGYDHAPARTVVAAPLLLGGAAHGVLVAGSLRDLDDDTVRFVESAASQLSVGLQNAMAHERIERLLDDLRESNEQLQAQSEELQAQNEEIQAQNEEIQAQNEEIQAQNEELQAQAAQLEQRTTDLEHQSGELRRHAALLTRADERKNEFLGLLAHELRNPLAPMTVSLYMLKEAPAGSDRALQAQAVLERQVKHLARLTDDLLDVTRISHGKIQIGREPVDLVEIVRGCIDDQRAAFSSKLLTLDIVLPPTSVWVDGDRVRLSQVFSNLLSNASKFTDAGDRVVVRLAPEGDEAVLEITDTGAGIDAAFLPDVFQPFAQGATGLARANGGLGLGLALVKALVEMHGGRVHAHSDGPGAGSRFVVRLPVRQAPAGHSRADAATPLVAPRRILLVEDNTDGALMLKEVLELQGHRVEVAHDGVDGLEKARAMVPDVVLCDIGLPGMDGYELARALRGDERLRQSMLVAVSGYAAEHDRERAWAAGFDKHLAKPLTVERLAEVLAEHRPGAPREPEPSV